LIMRSAEISCKGPESPLAIKENVIGEKRHPPPGVRA